jgi:Zn-dependent protease with chaperone function/Tfp pilus assembly protein PilE
MELVYRNEKILFGLMLGISILVWLLVVLGTLGVALVYILFFFIAYLFAHSALIAYLKGNAIHITEQQFPQLHQRIADCCQKLGIEDQPEAYLLQMGGTLNAFATRFLGRDFLVLYTDVVDALHDQPEGLNFYIGHELGHIKRKHLRWAPLLAPASILPLMGAAYHRAREYTCDRHGLAACADAGSATAGIAVLAAGGKQWKAVNQQQFMQQAEHSSGFWMSYHELIGDYPWLTKRMGAVHALAQGAQPDAPGRHPFAWLLAAITPRFGIGGGAGAIVFIAIIGILAAVSIPAYTTYSQKVKVGMAYAKGQQAADAVVNYVERNKRLPANLLDTGYRVTSDTAGVKDIVLNAQTGQIRVVTDIQSPAGPGFLILSPQQDENGAVRWHCSSENLSRQVLPQQCE